MPCEPARSLDGSRGNGHRTHVPTRHYGCAHGQLTHDAEPFCDPAVTADEIATATLRSLIGTPGRAGSRHPSNDRQTLSRPLEQAHGECMARHKPILRPEDKHHGCTAY